ncbi:MAG TPA: hypothetical protein VH682_16235 [Gemmataceae bacterium]
MSVWDLATGRQLFRLTGHEQAVQQVAFFSGGRFLLSCDAGGDVRLWDLKIGRQARRFDPAWGQCLAIAEDGARALTRSPENLLWVWELQPEAAEPARKVSRYERHSQKVERAFLFAGGRMAISISNEGKRGCRIWNAGTGIELRHPKGHEDFHLPLLWLYDRKVTAGFAPDGRLAVLSRNEGKPSPRGDRSMLVWEVVSRKFHLFERAGGSCLGAGLLSRLLACPIGGHRQRRTALECRGAQVTATVRRTRCPGAERPLLTRRAPGARWR